MPVYEAQCTGCEAQFEYVSKVSECLQVPRCGLCNAPARKVILHAAQGFVKGKFEAFKSTVDGSLISNARDLAEHNKRNRVVNLNEGYDEAKVVAGDFGQKEAKAKAVQDQKKEILAEVQESIHMVSNGHKPTVGVLDE